MKHRGTSGIMRVRRQTKRWGSRVLPEANRQRVTVDMTLGAPCTCDCPRCLAGEHDVCGRIACEARTR